MTQTSTRGVLPRITERQRQVAELLALGYANAEIAEQLGLTVSGAKYHVSELLHRLDLDGREDVAAWYRAERVRRGQVLDSTIFTPEEFPLEVRARAGELGWPSHLLDRAQELRVSLQDLSRWLRFGRLEEYASVRSADDFARWLNDRELLTFGTLRSRAATLGDNEALIALFERASEQSGDSDLVVERSPHAFAQFRLMENWHVQILEDRGVALAGVARAYPLIRFEGREIRIEGQLGFCVRDDARGHRYSRLISHVPRPANAWPVDGRVFYYLRADNLNGHQFTVHKGRTSAQQAPDLGLAVPGFPATVHFLVGTSHEERDTAIRPAEPRDLAECARIIESRYGETPFFIATSAEQLAARLDRGGFQDSRGYWPRVYGWGDLYVYERAGRVLACAGFWDAGEHVREVWTHRRTGRRTVVEQAAVLDAGYDAGAEDAYVALLHHMMRLAGDAGRNRLAVWLDRDPEIVDALSQRYEVYQETRALQCSLENDAPPEELSQPFVDLAYW